MPVPWPVQVLVSALVGFLASWLVLRRPVPRTRGRHLFAIVVFAVFYLATRIMLARLAAGAPGP